MNSEEPPREVARQVARTTVAPPGDIPLRRDGFPLTMDGVRSRLLKGSAWMAGARVSVNALGLVSTLLLARLLTPADFGLVAIATSLLAILGSVTELSLNQALVQHRDPTPDHFHAAWTLQCLRNLVLAAGFAAASIPAAAIFEEPRLTGPMLVLALSLVLQGLSNPRAIMMTRDLVFWQQFMLQVSAKLAGLIVSIAIALIYRSYWALVWGQVAAQAVTLLLSYSVLPFLPRPRLRGMRDLFGFSIWLTLGQIINTINWRLDHLFIGAHLGRSALGLYTVGDNLAIMPTREATLPLTQTLFPAFARISDTPERLRPAYQRAQALVTAIALPAGVGMALIAHPLVLLVMGAKWLPAVMVIQCLASVFAFQTLGSLSQPLAMATGNSRLLFWRDVQGFAIRVPTIVAGMFLAGLPGVLGARVLTGSVAIVLHMNVVRKITGLSMREQWGVNLRAITSVAFMAGTLMLLDRALGRWGDDSELLLLRLVAMILTGAVAYAGASTILWWRAGFPAGPETEVRAGLQNVLARLRRRRGSILSGD